LIYDTNAKLVSLVRYFAKKNGLQDMNPFSPGDRVQCKEKNRYNGTVMHIMCGICELCLAMPRNYTLCVAEDKTKVLVTYSNSVKRFKYNYSELELEPPLPIKPAHKTYDLSAKDIRPLGDITISVPLIVPDGLEEDEEGEDTCEVKQAINKPMSGMFLDKFLSEHTMERPI